MGERGENNLEWTQLKWDITQGEFSGFCGGGGGSVFLNFICLFVYF